MILCLYKNLTPVVLTIFDDFVLENVNCTFNAISQKRFQIFKILDTVFSHYTVIIPSYVSFLSVSF